MKRFPAWVLPFAIIAVQATTIAITLALIAFAPLAHAQSPIDAQYSGGCGTATFSSPLSGNFYHLQLDSAGRLCIPPISIAGGSAFNAQNQVFVAGVWQNQTGVLDGTAYAGLIDWNTSSQAHTDMIAPIPNCAASPACPGSIGGVNLLAPATLAVVGYTSSDPCSQGVKSTADFESTTSAGAVLVTGTAAKQTYICSIVLITSTAANVSLCESTTTSGATCSGGTPAGILLNTGTTAANGAAFAANGGITLGNGASTIAKTATTGQNIYPTFTTANTPQVNIHVSYVQQ